MDLLMEQEVSYRQVGREKGYVPPPRLNGSDGKRRRDGEKDAFGNRTQRFSSLVNDTPPPGAYFRRSTLERDSKTCGSVSAKGYGGGFVSSAPRFRNTKALQEAFLPGPGSYVESATWSEGGKLASFSCSKRDCGFAEDPQNTVPGPGQYNLRRELTTNRAGGTRPTSSFLCPRASLEKHGEASDTPAPGTYELLISPHPNVDKKGQVLTHPCFRSQTKRSTSFITPSEVPGPGEYDIDRESVTKKMSPRMSTAYGQGSKGMGTGAGSAGGGGKLGEPVLSKDEESASPGPGWYTPHQPKSAEKLPSSSSMFRSATKRFASAAIAAAPGPAFYQPEHLGKKSFRWNGNKKWV